MSGCTSMKSSVAPKVVCRWRGDDGGDSSSPGSGDAKPPPPRSDSTLRAERSTSRPDASWPPKSERGRRPRPSPGLSVPSMLSNVCPLPRRGILQPG